MKDQIYEVNQNCNQPNLMGQWDSGKVDSLHVIPV